MSTPFSFEMLVRDPQRSPPAGRPSPLATQEL